MKKTFLMLSLLFSVTPFFVSADDGPAFNCFDPKLTEAEIKAREGNDNPYFAYDNKIMGTCKKVNVSHVISIDPALQDEYLLGEHYPLNTIYDDPSYSPTKYSESLLLTSSTTLQQEIFGKIEAPSSYALFDKAYFIPLLSTLFKKEGITFSEKNFPAVPINVYNKDELATDVLNYFFPESTKSDFLYTKKNGEPKIVHTFKYQEYGKYIHAPKGQLVESQYVEVEQGASFLKDEDLQIRGEATGHWGMVQQPVVPITNPLKAVTNYWMYTKLNGKLVLQWQKSEYLLDDGKVKTITKDNKNVTAAMLFSNSDYSDGSTASKIASTSSTTAIIPVTEETEKPGFISKIITMILSWFE